MDCLKFSNWLANRDMYDVSEADKAIKHTEVCRDCRAKLHFDEQLDKYMHGALQKTEMPAALRRRVDISIDGMSSNRSTVRYRVFGVFSAAAAVMVVFGLIFMFSSTIPSVDEMGRYVIEEHAGHDDSVLVIDDIHNLAQLGVVDVSSTELMAQVPAGYTFRGGRICLLGQCEAIHLVFYHNSRRVSLYLIKTGDVDFSLSAGRHYSMQEGTYMVRFWKKGGYVYAMVG
ncbi:MAG: hypothetical protein ABR512_01830 [Desulfopila sp.]